MLSMLRTLAAAGLRFIQLSLVSVQGPRGMQGPPGQMGKLGKRVSKCSMTPIVYEYWAVVFVLAATSFKLRCVFWGVFFKCGIQL